MESVIGDFAKKGGALDALAHGMAELTKELVDHQRITLRQALFFVVLAAGNSHDILITLSDIKDITPDSDDVQLFGKNVTGRGYMIFLEETDGLGWLKQVTSVDDRRRKYLKLTSKGKVIAERIALAMR